MKADPRWGELYPGRILWDAYPFKSFSELFPNHVSVTGTFRTDEATLNELRNPPPRDVVVPTPEELALLEGLFPGCDPKNPPWLDVKAELLVAGVPMEAVMETSTRVLVRMVDRIRKGRSISDVSPKAETLADRARQIAVRIESLTDEIVSSFRLVDAEERTRNINSVALAISVDATPVIMWIERRRPDAATLEKRRLFSMEQQAVAAAGSDAPEYTGGVVSHNDGTRRLSDGARRTAELAAFCKMFGAAIRGWAADIEAEEDAAPQIPQIDPDQIAERLSATAVGQAGWFEYQRFITEALAIIFSPHLTLLSAEQKVDEGRSRIDAVFQNTAERGFFRDLPALSHVKCPFVIVECKNEVGDPKNDAFFQMVGRMTDSRGRLGFIVCRELKNQEDAITRLCLKTSRTH